MSKMKQFDDDKELFVINHHLVRAEHSRLIDRLRSNVQLKIGLNDDPLLWSGRNKLQEIHQVYQRSERSPYQSQFFLTSPWRTQARTRRNARSRMAWSSTSSGRHWYCHSFWRSPGFCCLAHAWERCHESWWWCYRLLFAVELTIRQWHWWIVRIPAVPALCIECSWFRPFYWIVKKDL